MSACERCWSDAYRLSRSVGGHQVDHYERLLIERADDPECAADTVLSDAVAHAEENQSFRPERGAE